MKNCYTNAKERWYGSFFLCDLPACESVQGTLFMEVFMARRVAIGIQQFDTLIERKCFYVDKTDFIREWWESGDDVTLITRPRRFGKTLNMSMTEQFFSVDYADRGDLFEGK